MSEEEPEVSNLLVIEFPMKNQKNPDKSNYIQCLVKNL